MLRERCADGEVRTEVERLLNQHEAAGSFLDGPAIPQRGVKPGQILADRFKIVRLAGHGGMGEVYEAHDTRLDRRVALKFLPVEFAFDRKALERFEGEARAIAALNHPHICTVHDTGSHEQWPFIVMEFVEGETLEHRLKKGPLPLDQALKHAIEIAGALDQAHRHGVIHRDLKPANIMLTKTGAKVLDFGLAKVRAREAAAGVSGATHTLTQEGAIAGTLQYMAPEQLEGKPVDTRTDIFAFGAVVYEMVTGRKAFEGESQAELIAAIMQCEPRPLPSVPATIARIANKCLAKEPDRRWQTASDLTDELRWVELEAAPEKTINVHRPWPWILTATSLCIAVVLAVLYFRKGPAESLPVKFTFHVDGPYPMGAVSPDGRLIAFTGAEPGGPDMDSFFGVANGDAP